MGKRNEEKDRNITKKTDKKIIGKNSRKNKGIITAVIVAVIVLVGTAGATFFYFGGFGTGKCADTDEFARYSVPIDEIKFPEESRIIAIGEATHGNAEFQELKLDVFKAAVEKNGVRAFGLEGDFGGCEYVNRYIHGGDGTAENAAAAIGFAIYRTEQMEKLIEWMREYNENAEPGQDLRFYGFDMQRVDYNFNYLKEAAEKYGVDTSKMDEIWDYENGKTKEGVSVEERIKVYEEIRRDIELESVLFVANGRATENDVADGQATEAKSSEPNKQSIETGEADNNAYDIYESTEQALHFADTLIQNAELSKVIDSADGSGVRDEMMAENTIWILAQEEARGNNCIFISGHNGHIEQFGSYDENHKVMGNLLADEIGDAYFAIGTDFYKSSCNLPKSNGKRLTHTFYSQDPLAKAAVKCGYDICWMDFGAIEEGSEFKTYVNEYMWMGTIGEIYSPVMRVIPMTYRLWKSPAESFDGVIYVADAHPTVIK